MQWRDLGFVLSVKHFEEKWFLINALTENNGLRPGLIRKNSHDSISMGLIASLTWFGKEQNSLGKFAVEALYNPLPYLLIDYQNLLPYQAFLSLVEDCCRSVATNPKIFILVRKVITEIDKPQPFDLKMIVAELQNLLGKELLWQDIVKTSTRDHVKSLL